MWRLNVWLAAACGLCADPPDLAVTRLMGSGRSGVMHRAPVDAALDVVVAYGTPANWQAPVGDWVWWSEKSRVGIFLQRREAPGVVYQISIVDGRGDDECAARVERATLTEVVISCAHEKGGPGPNRKFVYDARAKALIRRVDTGPFPMARLVENGGKVRLIGAVVLEFEGGAEPGFRVLPGAVGGRAARQPAIPALRRSSFDELQAMRPRRVKDGYARGVTTISEEVGAWQRADGTLWMGKSFQDGEGQTGVGGFGYFDGKGYRMYSPAEVWDWSVTAMLVEKECVWLELAGHGEWGSGGGGVIRFDRATERVEKFALRDIVRGMTRVGERIVMATEFGAAVIEGTRVRRFFVDGGRVLEGVGGG